MITAAPTTLALAATRRVGRGDARSPSQAHHRLPFSTLDGERRSEDVPQTSQCAVARSEAERDAAEQLMRTEVGPEYDFA